MCVLMDVLHCVCITNECSWVLSNYTKEPTRITRLTWRRASFICVMANQIEKIKKLFVRVFFLFLECSVYAWHPRPISGLDTPAFQSFTFQNTVLFQSPRSQKQQTHLLLVGFGTARLFFAAKAEIL